MLALLGAGGAAAAFGLRGSPESNAGYFLLTDDPDGDLMRLRRLVRLSDVSVSSSLVSAVGQDLTIFSNGRLLDPVTHGGLADLALMMRGRSGPATCLLQVEAASAEPRVLTIQCEGNVHEVISLDRSYRRIEVPGPAGRTVLRLDEGVLSVTEASCRHENCLKLGARSHGRIICAPNKLVATLPGRPAGYDVLAG